MGFGRETRKLRQRTGDRGLVTEVGNGDEERGWAADGQRGESGEIESKAGY